MFAIVDTETTGLDPERGHRLVEVAVTRVGANLAVDDEWDTLLNPQRNVGASAVHGLRFIDVEEAPTFEEVAGDILDLLAGRIVVCHNARFDVGFLRSEYRRVGYRFRPDAVCTLTLAKELGYPSRLRECCEALEVPLELGHAARIDSAATARVLPLLLAQAADAAIDLRFSPVAAGGLAVGRTGRRVPRREPFRPSTHRFVSKLIGRLHIAPTGGVVSEAAAAYADLLDRALEDRVLSDDDARSLADVAERWSLTSQQMQDVNHSYFATLAGVALLDGVLSREEISDLARVADLLAIEPMTAEQLLTGAAAAVRHMPSLNRTGGFSPQVAGKAVCFAHGVSCRIDGRLIDRPQAELLAAAAGLVVAPHLSPAVDIYVHGADATGTEEARDLGVQVIAERVFWPSIGVSVD